MAGEAKGSRARSEKVKGFDYVRSGIADYPAPTRALLAFCYFVVYVVGRILWPTTIENEGALLAETRGHGRMIVMNHTSMVEPIVFITRMWRRGVLVRPIYKLDFEKVAIVRWLFRRLGGIPIDRGSADLGAIRAAKDALQRGECILVYPEGTRIKSDDQKIKVHGGFAMIAQMAKTDVIPTAVVGAADPYHTRRTRRRMPVIAHGAPISFSSLDAKGRKAQMGAMEQAAMSQVYALRDDLRARHPGLW